MSDDEQQIRQLIERWHTATRSGDIDTVMNLMTDDVVFLLPGRPPMNKAEFESLSRVPPGSPRPQFSSSFQILEVVVSGNLATIWTQLSVEVTPPGDAPPMKRSGHTLTVFRKDEGQWRISRDANLLSPVNPS